MTESAIYEGVLTHVRRTEPVRSFRYGVYMLYLDLDELPGLTLFPALGVERAAFSCFRRSDYLGPPERPLKEAVKDEVERVLGKRPDGAVRLLTHVRTLGRAFNPVSFYYCFEADGGLAAVVAEITNTPWGERHAYVVPATSDMAAANFPKAFHVSPFLPMDHRYDWELPTPRETLSIEMRSEQAGREVFRARLGLARRPLTRLALARRLLLSPFMSLRVLAAIYFQALRLWLHRAPFYSHPPQGVANAARNES
jgi:uncharacterized protein